jgi:pyruvate dehydrogenase E2 component (dihydrolipoamide acetyltransferase)
MPSLGADMDAGTLVEWRIRPGEHVERGAVVALVETEKATMEIESFEGGTVSELVVAPGTKVPVGQVLARFDGAGPPPVAPAVSAAPPPAAAAERLRISPAARRLARERGIDPHGLAGSGPHGAIVLRDVDAAMAPPPAPSAPAPATAAVTAPATAPTPVTARPSAAPAGLTASDLGSPLRQAIGQAMSRSKREIPHFYLAHTVSMRRALDWLAAHNAALPAADRVLPAALLLRAVARALWEVPELNGFWLADGYRASEPIHLGMAVSLRGGGVVAPAIHHADDKSVDELMADLRDLVRRTRSGGLRASEMSDPTITVTSLGERGAELVVGVINPPQVAIVGFGSVVDRPWAEAGQVVVHPTVAVTLAADHRVVDGHRGGLFLAAIDRLLQEPEHL